MFFHPKVVIHLTDGLDAPYAEMKQRVENLRLSGKLYNTDSLDSLSLNICQNIMLLYLVIIKDITVSEKFVCAKQV